MSLFSKNPDWSCCKENRFLLSALDTRFLSEVKSFYAIVKDRIRSPEPNANQAQSLFLFSTLCNKVLLYLSVAVKSWCVMVANACYVASIFFFLFTLIASKVLPEMKRLNICNKIFVNLFRDQIVRGSTWKTVYITDFAQCTKRLIQWQVGWLVGWHISWLAG